MDVDILTQTGDWTKTKEAVANFRQLLLCSKCSKLMKEPVCLGLCEHMLCRSCAGPQAGDGCVVCHSPAWVKDIQINRQLSNIAELFCSLESLLNPTKKSDSSVADTRTHSGSPLLKHKKNFKIWFSPRSRKVRCMVDKSSEVTLPGSSPSRETISAQPDAITAQCKDLSVFNFNSSSQDSGSTSPQRCNNDNRNRKKRSTKIAANRKPAATRKQTKQKMKKKRLEAINQQWGISTEEEVLSEGEQACGEGQRRSSKRVSFLSPGVSSKEPEPVGPQGYTDVLSPSSSIQKGSLSDGTITVLEDQAQPVQSVLASPFQHDTLSANDPKPKDDTGKGLNLSPPKHTPKRSGVEEKGATLESTPKRPRTSPGQRRRSLGQLACPSQTSPRYGKSSPCSPATVGRKPVPGSPAFMKRNHKGETPLHLAAIKVEKFQNNSPYSL